MRWRNGNLTMAVLATLAVAIPVILGLGILGPPGMQRSFRMDERRVTDLTAAARAVDLYWTRSGRLPSSLDEVADSGITLGVSDPLTGQAYAYRALDEGSYELCAEFERASEESSVRAGRTFWLHPAGRQCFEIEAQELTR